MIPQEIRRRRLESDYQEMINLKGPIIQWNALEGIEPFVDKYELTVNIRSIIGPLPTYRERHKIVVTLPGNYPMEAPQVFYPATPRPYHPNWWPAGSWCYGTWNNSESLGYHILRMLRILQFDPAVTNENSPTDRDLKMWYCDHKSSDLFPCDKQQLPDPTSKKLDWGTNGNQPEKKLRFI